MPDERNFTNSYMIKPFILFLFVSLTFTSCSNNPGNTNEQRLRTENFELRQQIDSLRNLISKFNRIEADTLLKLPEEKPVTNDGGFTGTHALSLQWIGWDKPGTATIIPAENGWYTITGKQEKNEDYLKINGRIRPLNERELEFIGEIETLITHLNNGQPCLKTGKKSFKATGDRQYWRLQDMNNCEGSTLDYIDIYF